MAVGIIQGVLQESNAAIDKETRQNALVDLNERVEEWKSLRIDTFGELMLFGSFTVLKGDGSTKDQEKEVCWVDSIQSFRAFSLLTGAIVVSHLPIRTDLTLLQRYQPESTEIEVHGKQRKAVNQWQRSSTVTAQRSNLPSECDASLNPVWTR
jgi:calcineurin-like phosphoesterase family protein